MFQRLIVSRTVARSVAPRRAMSTVPPSSGTGKETTATAGGNTLLLVGGVAALAGIGYYMTRREKTPPSMEDVKKEARDLRDVSKEKSEAAARDAKGRVEQDVDRAKASGQSVLDRTKTAARDVKVGTEERLASARATVENYTEDAKREAEREAQLAKEKASGWFSWGKDKSEEGKEKTAREVARGAENVRDTAQKHA